MFAILHICSTSIPDFSLVKAGITRLEQQVLTDNPLSANIKDYIRQKQTVLSDVLNTGPTAPIIGNAF